MSDGFHAAAEAGAKGSMVRATASGAQAFSSLQPFRRYTFKD